MAGQGSLNAGVKRISNGAEFEGERANKIARLSLQGTSDVGQDSIATEPKSVTSNDDTSFESSKQPFRLLDLPTEIRLEIYRACITRPFNIMLSKPPLPPTRIENDGTDLHNHSRRRSPRNRPAAHISRGGYMSAADLQDFERPLSRKSRAEAADPLLVNLLATCSLVYREARPVLYGENKFDLPLDTGRSTLAALHQRSRGNIHSLRVSIPAGNEALERFAELVRLGLRYCWRLQTLTLNMCSTYESSPHPNVFANAFDNLRWLQKDCQVILEGKVDAKIEKVVKLKAALAKSLDEVRHPGHVGNSKKPSLADLGLHTLSTDMPNVN